MHKLYVCVLEKGHNSFYDIWRGAYFAYSAPRKNEAIPSPFVTLSRSNNFNQLSQQCFSFPCFDTNDKDSGDNDHLEHTL